MKTTATLDKEDVRQAAAGRWPEILANVGRIESDFLDGKHHECPRCGGKDRFRFIDKKAGAVLCNQCFPEKCGDGFAAVGWLVGCNFPEAVQKVAEYLGLDASQNGQPSTDPDTFLERLARCKGLTLAGLKAFGAELAQGKFGPVARFPMYDAKGKSCSTCDLPVNGNGKFNEKGKSVGLFLPEGKTPQPGETWCVVEGPTSAAALHDLGHNACGLPGNEMHSKFARLFKDVNVVVIPDRDIAGIRGGDETAGKLYRIASSVRVAVLPCEPREKEGEDVRSLLRQSDGERFVRDAIDHAREWNPPTSDEHVPTIEIGPDERRVNDEAIDALSNMPEVYQRGGKLVHIVCDAPPPANVERPEDAPRIAVMKPARVRELLADAANWFFRNKDGDPLRQHPPKFSVEGVMARGSWPNIPAIYAITETPYLRPDGTVCYESGYDPQTGIFLAARGNCPAVPSHPTLEQSKQASRDLLEVVQDFPFKKEEHRAAWLASVLTPLVRFAYGGPTPLFLTDANIRGAGKGLAADCAVLIATGREPARTTMPRGDDEMRKRITSIAYAGEPVVLIDNITGELNSPSFNAALTSVWWNDRILCKSEMTGRLPMLVVWYGTANNIVLGEEAARRTVHIRIETPEEKPEERTGFKHPELIRWVEAERPRLLAAALTLLRGYMAAGMPDQGLTPWGSYEGWSRMIRNAVVWCGLNDPGSTREGLAADAVSDANLHQRVLAGWREADPESNGLTVAEAVTVAGDKLETKGRTLHDALLDFEEAKDGKLPSNRSIGMKLHHWQRKVCEKMYFERGSETRTATWTVKDAKEWTEK